MNIFLIGHKPPDLDTVASAVEYKELLEKIKRYEATLIPVLPEDPNKETEFIFNKFDVTMPKLLDEYEVESTDAFILVDHNEETQRHEKVNSEQIIEIVDHHKININFTSPLRIDVRPLGSTSTIIFNLFEMYGLTPSKKIAGLMLASILSDTQGLKSKLTTGYDSDVAHKLAKSLELDLEKFIFEIFKAKSDITGLSIEQISTKDYKIFDFNGNKVLINQVETVEPEKVLDKKQDIISIIDELKVKHGVEQIYIVVTDILKVNSQVIYATDEEKKVLEKAFTGEGRDGLIDIGPRMSRKKDIAPEIEKVLLQAT